MAAASDSRASRRMRLDAHEVGVQHFGRRNEPRELEALLHRLHRRRDRRADRDVIEHFAPQAVGDLAPNLRRRGGSAGRCARRAASRRTRTRARARRARREARRPSTRTRAGWPAWSRPRCRPPHRASPSRPRRRRRAATTSRPALIEPALLHHVRRRAWPPESPAAFASFGARGAEIRVEEVGRRRGLDAARALHRLVFGKQLERDRRRAVDELVQEDPQLAAGALDRPRRRPARRASGMSSRRASWRSISSVKATTASSPTIWIAPAAWWMCVRACLSDARSLASRETRRAIRGRASAPGRSHPGPRTAGPGRIRLRSRSPRWSSSRSLEQEPGPRRSARPRAVRVSAIRP